MSRRFWAAVAALSLALVGALADAPPAGADSTVTIRSLPDQSDSNPTLIEWGCASTSDHAQYAVHIVGSSPSPVLGEVSWGGMLLSGVGQFGPAVDVTSSGDLATFSEQVYGVTGVDAMVLASPPGMPSANDGWVGTSITPVPAAGSWQTVSLPLTTNYTWVLYDFSQSPWQPVGSPEVRTLAGFEAAHGVSSDYLAGLLAGCGMSSGQSYYFDDLQVGASGSVTTYDYEKVTNQIKMGATPAPITAGGSATITSPAPGPAQLTLQQRAYGSSSWTTVRTVDKGTDGTFSTKVAPTRQTAYRWETPESGCCLESFSPAVTVKVRSKVTLRLADRTIRKGQDLTATGSTTPHKAVAVTLWRRTATGSSVLARGRTRSDGSYRLSYRVPSKGTWKVFTTVAAGSGNLAGQSPVVSATVS